MFVRLTCRIGLQVEEQHLDYEHPSADRAEYGRPGKIDDRHVEHCVFRELPVTLSGRPLTTKIEDQANVGETFVPARTDSLPTPPKESAASGLTGQESGSEGRQTKTVVQRDGKRDTLYGSSSPVSERKRTLTDETKNEKGSNSSRVQQLGDFELKKKLG